MDSYKAAKRMLDTTNDNNWQAAIRACAHALIAIAERIDSDLQEKNRGLMDELDRMRSRLTQAYVETDKLKAEQAELRETIKKHIRSSLKEMYDEDQRDVERTRAFEGETR